MQQIKENALRGKTQRHRTYIFMFQFPALTQTPYTASKKKKITCCLHASNYVHKMEAMPLYHNLTRINQRLWNV